jgi:Na+/proline symporter
MLLATGIVSAVCLGLPLPETVLLIGGVAIVYTTFGGIVADIYSDIVQLAVLYAGTLVTIGILVARLDASAWGVLQAEAARLRVFDFRSTGWGDGQTFAFWPMLLGGFFLYLSYYGCDQSQTQRLLTTPTPAGAQRALMLNGLLRFPLVLTYCAVGVLLIPYLASHPGFTARLAGHPPDFLVPYFLQEHLPTGVLGLIVAGIFAASMSSLDSALNSLSAATWQDFLTRWRPGLAALPDRVQVRISRCLTIGWGAISTGFALAMIGGSETVLEMVNKIGSAFYGPVLAVFLLGMLTRRAGQAGALAGLAAGVGLNLYLWQAHSADVSWMWWNVAGFGAAVIVGGLVGLTAPAGASAEKLKEIPAPFPSRPVLWLLAAFPLFLAAGWLIQTLLVNR